MDNISKNYTSNQKHLISISVIKNRGQLPQENMIEKIKLEMAEWFDVSDWDFLDSFKINYLLPYQLSVKNPLANSDIIKQENSYNCGDYLCNRSTNSAIYSRKRVFEIINNFNKN
ncbi:hypothetical protein I5M32_01360 [Pedobacter sp. SD-b]|uniref:Ubiquitin-like protease family profile domain-containing protein n=1 Tax=Pedobacter segetis TaxID=2793069 RepID=A0ABS1BFJ9_9SPHI|nr:hypothetical protein [Pedobacter segetis]MBK0381595.1 hypothetical protein [Pedobacter segetis]